ncbi:3',5'-nucleoside bisphosphate phosphatase [Methylotenera versatilis]|uniref:PHP domain protein n=1 Tax=Methylotenera versatilis (strain 301) TaxID=666681 RepID=D7DPF4_METV0|nr:3',5'-nucleoside bisphosphate phosphatase [Methylotenera versatilis]ADI29198.1 PHP domain protein [Methylotenera versatilis 301]
MPLTFDLHSHTTVSDGMLSPVELVAYAAKQGVDVLALTDHDDTGGLAVAAEEAKRWGLHFINGVEISVTWKKRTIHIVGLKINPEYPALKAGLAALRAGRHTRAEGMAAGLDKVGITGSLEGAYQYVNDGIIGRIHFARFLVENGVSKDNKSVFKKYLVKGKPGYFEHQWASLEEAIGWIVDSGGVAVLAHPGRYDLGRTNMLLLLEEFRALGGTAIEVVTGSHTGAHYVEFAKYAQMFSLKSSVGTDYHGKGVSFMEMGRLPALPSNCVPIWQDWPEALLTSTNLTKINTTETAAELI